MTNFRFRYKHLSYKRWRYRMCRVRVWLLVVPLESGARCAPSMVVWRRTQPVEVVPTPVPFILQVGTYLVGEESDHQLTGHPEIRY